MNIFTFTKEGVLFAASMVMVAVALSSLLTGCGGTKADTPKDVPAGTMLVDYYHAVKATVGGDGYSELVLYSTEDDTTVKLCVYGKADGDSDETCTEYLVPCKAAERCFEIIEQHSIHRWNGKENAESSDGSITVLKYYDNGEYIRVTTEKMPPDGEKILSSIRDIMEEYAREECLAPFSRDDDTEVEL